MDADDDLRSALQAAAAAPSAPPPSAATLAGRVRHVRRRRRLASTGAVMGMLLALGLPSAISIGFLDIDPTDVDVAFRDDGSDPEPPQVPPGAGMSQDALPARLVEVVHPAPSGTPPARQLDSAELFQLDDRLRAGSPLGSEPLRAGETVLEIVVAASTCVPTFEGMAVDDGVLVPSLGEERQFAAGAYLERSGCRAVLIPAALRIAVDQHALPSPLRVTVPDPVRVDTAQPVPVTVSGAGWETDPRGVVVPFQSLGPRTALDLALGDARQVVGEELFELDAALEREFAGQPDPLQPQDVALAIAPLRCTPRVAHLRLDGDRLLVHTQDGGCTDGGEGDVGVDTVVVDRAALPERFEVVIDAEGEEGRVQVPTPVIELAPDAPQAPAPAS